MAEEKSKFEVIVRGIIFDSEKKKFLIGRGENEKDMGWVFPGGRLRSGEEIDKALKRIIKLKTGYLIKNIGTFFSRTYDEKPDIVSISFLTKIFEGEELPADNLVELKWATPQEIDEHLKIPMHKKLKEFLLELI